MGDESEDILNASELTEGDKLIYEKVKRCFVAHFIGEHNVIFERAKFNMRKQEPGETAESFITAVHKQADYCKFGALRDELIHDRIVVGIRDVTLSEKLQMDAKLTLTTAVQRVKQSETVKQQQGLLRGASGQAPIKEPSEEMHALSLARKKEGSAQQRARQNKYATSSVCYKCGRAPSHNWKDCPAKEAACRKCHKRGHFAAVCKSKQPVHEVADEEELCQDSLFLGEVRSDSTGWYSDVKLNGTVVSFKLDTGAAVTAIPTRLYSYRRDGPLLHTPQKLFGPNYTRLAVVGKIQCSLESKNRDSSQPVFVIDNLARPLLGLPALTALHLVERMEEIDTPEVNGDPEKTFKKKFPKVFTGLGRLEGDCHIRLREGAVPYALTTPRRVPIPLTEKVKEELKRMEEMGVISRIEKPTEWCAGIVVVPKPNCKIRLCVDLTKLNESMCRERHILPSVDQSLAQLNGAQFFTKLDARSGFWQIPLAQEKQRYAQVEKEALAVTWACERLSSYLIGLQFTIETDHKPLLALLGTKALDDLPPRIQRFRLRLLRFTYNIVHVPGKALITADTLSRAPIRRPLTAEETQMEGEVQIFVHNLPASQSKLQQIAEHQRQDVICSQLILQCKRGRPRQEELPQQLKTYWVHQGELHMNGDLLMKGQRIVIPETLQNEMFARLHEGHMGISKCKLRAQQSVWWLGLSAQITKFVAQCEICAKHQQLHPEPMTPSELPMRPWQKIGADMFYWQNYSYLLVVDYYSRYIEIIKTSITTSAGVINGLKSIFARHGVPEILITDNGPQFSSSSFSSFATDYDFRHVTSSPYFAQSNGEAERAVKTVKSLLKKNTDPYKALLAYRVTPLHQGPSLAELLMGRRLRSPLPVSPGQLKPKWPDQKKFADKDQELKQAQMLAYNKRHRAGVRPELKAGQRVWITNTHEPATVLREADTPRSYVVETDSEEVRRNKAHLRPLPDIQTPTQTVGDTEQTTGPEEREDEQVERARPKREVKAPAWLKDYVQ
ncbi:hypothetical protein MHYP_G00316320 [Metynnis hypsauchen]